MANAGAVPCSSFVHCRMTEAKKRKCMGERVTHAAGGLELISIPPRVLIGRRKTKGVQISNVVGKVRA